MLKQGRLTMLNDNSNTNNDTLPMIGRREHTADAIPDVAVEVAVDVNINKEHNDNTNLLQPIGWGALTFGAGAMLGWLASTKSTKRVKP
jgi:hypothetical protein